MVYTVRTEQEIIIIILVFVVVVVVLFCFVLADCNIAAYCMQFYKHTHSPREVGGGMGGGGGGYRSSKKN